MARADTKPHEGGTLADTISERIRAGILTGRNSKAILSAIDEG